MKILSILFVGWAGYRIGKSDLRIRYELTLITVLLAGFLHKAVQLALPHDAIDRLDSAATWSVVYVAVALLESSGMLIPVLLVPWAAPHTRIAASWYIIGAATQGALVYYQPFDVVIMNGQRQGPTHPAYEVALIFGLLFAPVPFAFGVVAKLRQTQISEAQRTAAAGERRGSGELIRNASEAAGG